MIHPLDPSRRIFFWLCSTHQFKSGRNQLWAGRHEGKRHFVSADGFPFGWAQVWDRFERNQKQGAKASKLVHAALLLDKWAKINVHFAKTVFCWDTLADELASICALAKIAVPRLDESEYETNSHCFRPVLRAEYMKGKSKAPLLGMVTARLTKVKDEINQRKAQLGNSYIEIMSKVANLEYRTAMHDISNEVLMNRELHLTKDNVLGFKSHLQQRLQYFQRWYHAMKEIPEEGAGVTFLSLQIWLNLRITVCGFIEYAIYKVTRYPSLIIPMLFSNTSHVEATFSQVRGLGGRDAATFMTRIACRQVDACMHSLEGSSSYSTSEHLQEQDIDDGRFEVGCIKALNKDVEKSRRRWVLLFADRPSCETMVGILPQSSACRGTSTSTSNHDTRNLTQPVLVFLTEKVINSHFSKVLAEETSLPNRYVLVSYAGSSTSVFESFVSMAEAEECRFDAACQNAIQTILLALAKTIAASESYVMRVELARLKGLSKAAEKDKNLASAKKSRVKPPESFVESACLRFIQGNEVVAFRESLPSEECRLDRTFGVIVFQALVEVAEKWIVEAVVAARRKVSSKPPSSVGAANSSLTGTISAMVTIDIESEVHRFVGSGVCAFSAHARKRALKLRKLIEQREKQFKPAKRSHTKCLESVNMSLLLMQNIGILWKDLPSMHDKSYDSPVLAVRDKGGFLYISPKFLRWAKDLMKTIRASISPSFIAKRGNLAQKEARDFVVGNVELKNSFRGLVRDLEMASSLQFNPESVERVLSKIIDYAFHARSGVEWEKYKADHTDRTAGKEKKMGRREMLKGSGGSKIEK